jgi:hypothetical protein
MSLPPFPQDAAVAYAGVEKEAGRVRGKLEAFEEKARKGGKSEADAYESAEGRKLLKKRDDAEDDLQAVAARMEAAQQAFNERMPRSGFHVSRGMVMMGYDDGGDTSQLSMPKRGDGRWVRRSDAS